ncbi:MAG: DUF2974 domain-containing protein [Candidatus Metalachnospira sp.]|nr:DUF2974 domain-containing protein [Candidatus Metalachnospira sp.]
MANILDYIDWRGDITLEQSPFNDIDNLIFTQLCFIDFDSIVPSFDESSSVTIAEAADSFFASNIDTDINMGVLVPNFIVSLFKKMSECQRFRDMRLTKYINKIDYDKQQQFAALTIILGDGSNYIAFRGTDDTIIGWKEDFNMGFLTPVPSQLTAVKYINGIASELEGSIMIGGHSKGGNLAVYSAVYCNDEVKKRITHVFNNDGPGFTMEIMSIDEYVTVVDRIKTIIPESSVVGMLLEHEEKYTIVKSAQSGILQHDSFSWQVLGTNFIIADGRSAYSEITDIALRTWVNGMDKDERVLFVDTLFDLLECTDATTLTGLNSDKLKTASSLLKKYKSMNDEQRSGMNKILISLFRDGAAAVIKVLNANYIKKSSDKDKHHIKKVLKQKTV